jgi:hypothetical protein
VSLTNDETKAKKECASCAGTYKTGMNMVDGTVHGYTLDDLILAATTSNNNSNNNNSNRKNSICPHCRRKGNITMRSTKKCLHHNRVPTAVPAAAGIPEEEDEQATEPIASAARNSLAQAICDMDNYDCYPLTDDPPSNVSLSAFEDAGTWSEDEDGGFLTGAL